MNRWTPFLSILGKDMRNYYLKPPNISWGMIFPVAWTLMFFLRSPGAVDLRDILPGVMSLSVLFGTTSMLAVTITFERRGRAFERLLLAPISLNLLLLAKTSGAIIFGFLNALFPLVLALFLVDVSGTIWPLVLVAVTLTAITSTFLGLFIAVSVSEVFEAQTFSNFFRFPMLFLCGLFIPLDSLPSVIRPLSYALPLTYANDLLRHAILGQGFLPVILSLPILMLFAWGLFYFSLINVEKHWLL